MVLKANEEIDMLKLLLSWLIGKTLKLEIYSEMGGYIVDRVSTEGNQYGVDRITVEFERTASYKRLERAADNGR